MLAAVFVDQMLRTRKVILWAVLLEVLFAICAGLFLMLGDQRMVVIMLSATALVVYCLALAYLWVFYLRRTEVKEKYRLRAQLKQTLKAIDAAQGEISLARQQASSIRKDAQTRRAEQQFLFEANIAALDERIGELNKALADELEAALERLQNAYIAEKLKAIPFDHTLVPGIGEVLGEKLREHGIHNANDMRHEPLQRIPGIGSGKATSLVWWRESLEPDLRLTQPAALPDEERQAIEANHAGPIESQVDEKKRLAEKHEKWLADIQTREANDLAAAAALEVSTSQQLTELDSQKQDLTEGIDAYGGITFFSMLSNVLANPGAKWHKRIQSSLVLVVLAFAATMNVLILLAALAGIV